MSNKKPRVMEYETPAKQVEPRRRFLARPFWRDYVLAFILLGMGILMVDVAAPRRGADRWWILGPALASFITGFIFFVCAIGHGVWSWWKR